jgi:hypothetical protein
MSNINIGDRVTSYNSSGNVEFTGTIKSIGDEDWGPFWFNGKEINHRPAEMYTDRGTIAIVYLQRCIKDGEEAVANKPENQIAMF